MPEERRYQPAFAKADLPCCEHKPIHLAGSIQPHGVLLVLQEPGYLVVQASSNAAAALGIPGSVLGRSMAELPGNLAECIGPHLDAPLLHTMPLAVRCSTAR